MSRQLNRCSPDEGRVMTSTTPGHLLNELNDLLNRTIQLARGISLAALQIEETEPSGLRESTHPIGAIVDVIDETMQHARDVLHEIAALRPWSPDNQSAVEAAAS